MSEYLVRWKFGPNSLLNHQDVETLWYQQFHPSKKKAVEHYTSLLLHSLPAYQMTAEIFQLVQLVPGKEEPVEPMTIDELVVTIPEKVDPNGARNKKIMELWKKGYNRRAIAEEMDLNYHQVYSVIRRLDES